MLRANQKTIALSLESLHTLAMNASVASAALAAIARTFFAFDLSSLSLFFAPQNPVEYTQTDKQTDERSNRQSLKRSKVAHTDARTQTKRAQPSEELLARQASSTTTTTVSLASKSARLRPLRLFVVVVVVVVYNEP